MQKTMSNTLRDMARLLILAWVLTGAGCLAPTEGPVGAIQPAKGDTGPTDEDASQTGVTDGDSDGNAARAQDTAGDASGNGPPFEVMQPPDTFESDTEPKEDAGVATDVNEPGSDAESDAPENGAEALCDLTGGAWDTGSCGHWVCGASPDCEALIPGCNCGVGKVFDEATGCVESEACGDIEATPSDLCADSGGEWLDGTCGHWECGLMPQCKAIIPGCNCGSGHVFDEVAGCIASPECEKIEAEAHQKLCEGSGGEWLPESCGDWKCGLKPLCKAIIPGCNCGAGMSFDAQTGCYMDPTCGGI